MINKTMCSIGEKIDHCDTTIENGSKWKHIKEKWNWSNESCVALQDVEINSEVVLLWVEKESKSNRCDSTFPKIVLSWRMRKIKP